jgi:hypothetical protein
MRHSADASAPTPSAQRSPDIRLSMSLASYILTYRGGDTPHRRRNLDAVLGWLARDTDFDVLVIEQDDAPRLDGPLAHPKAQVVFAHNPGPFNKSWGYNLGARLAPGAVLVFGDADVIVGPAVVDAARYVLGGHRTAKPYRRLVDLDDVESARVAAGDYDFVPGRPGSGREAQGEHLVFAGGVFAIARDAFHAIGQWDERFLGWGGEDDALTYCIERARLSGIELDTRPAVHLAHPRPPGSTFGQPHYAANRALLDGYREHGDAALRRYAEVQLQLAGYRDKYRPRNGAPA